MFWEGSKEGDMEKATVRPAPMDATDGGMPRVCQFIYFIIRVIVFKNTTPFP